ncbi:hypothetical protein CFB34_038935 [Burkholderia sp. HI4860]|uniref:hypothetical protein n=1 Tax=Burkholderia sp. HI4860 TaxID=2015361 RepID=UPI001F61201F|nr:hypothetical protein [Burkholderia sp. HI4860]MCI3974959.1 hypothetical protein [Burkholderia sp. HI4860]
MMPPRRARASIHPTTFCHGTSLPLLFAYLAAIVLLIATARPGRHARGRHRRAARLPPGDADRGGRECASLVMIAGAMLMVFGVVLVSERLLTGLHVAGCVFIAVLAIRTLLGEWRAGRTRDGNDAREGEPASQARGLPASCAAFSSASRIRRTCCSSSRSFRSSSASRRIHA